MRFIRACTLLLGFFSGAATASPLIDQLVGSAESFLQGAIEEHLASSTRDANYRIEISRLDNRLRLPLCDENALQTTLESPQVPIGRVTVRVSCNSPSSWRLFVPAQVSLRQSVLVTTRPLLRHSILAAGDLALVERDITTTADSFLTSPDTVIGLRLRRALPADTALTPQHLEQNQIISRGDKVIIRSSNERVSVRMPGEALEAGSIGSQIRVRNSRSDRVIHARITGPGEVRVGP